MMTRRTTVYLDPKLLRAVKIKAVQMSVSVSDLISESIRLSLKEDDIDLKAIKNRIGEPARSYEAVLKDLKRDGLL